METPSGPTPANKTMVTEIATALGIANAANPKGSLGICPPELSHVPQDAWDHTHAAFGLSEYSDLVDQSFLNGQFFLESNSGLRGRPARSIEWAGPRRSPGDEVTPVDLRVDHVYLISCKYMSKITMNASPSHLFERLLTGGHGRRGSDWFESCAPAEFHELWTSVKDHLGRNDLGVSPSTLDKLERRAIAKDLTFRRWPDSMAPQYEALCSKVAALSAERWQRQLDLDKRSTESMMWRLLRIGAAPYFVLGAHGNKVMRLRVLTPWDWRQNFEFRALHIEPKEGGQPMVSWSVEYRDREHGTERVVEGHVEIRWSHGRFSGPPEAKVYLDTGFDQVPGYVPLI